MTFGYRAEGTPSADDAGIRPPSGVDQKLDDDGGVGGGDGLSYRKSIRKATRSQLVCIRRVVTDPKAVGSGGGLDDGRGPLHQVRFEYLHPYL